MFLILIDTLGAIVCRSYRWEKQTINLEFKPMPSALSIASRYVTLLNFHITLRYQNIVDDSSGVSDFFFFESTRLSLSLQNSRSRHDDKVRLSDKFTHSSATIPDLDICASASVFRRLLSNSQFTIYFSFLCIVLLFCNRVS